MFCEARAVTPPPTPPPRAPFLAESRIERVIAAQFRRPVQADASRGLAGSQAITRRRARGRVTACTRARQGGRGGQVARHFARRRCWTCSGATLAGGATARREGCRRAMQVRLGHAHTRQPSSLITGLGLAHTRAAAQARSRRQPWVYPFHTCSQPHRPPQHMRPPGRCAASRRGDGLDRTGPCRAGPGQRSTGQRRSRGFSGRRL